MLGRRDGIAKAQRRFDQGHVEEAARLLFAERRQAVANSDSARLAEIDRVSTLMRQRLENDIRLIVFDANLEGRAGRGGLARVVNDESAGVVTPLSLGIVLAGAGLMLIAVFLPQFESNTFARIEKNTLVQNGDGWWFIILAVLAAGAAYRAYRNQRRSFAAVVFGLIGIGLAFYYGTSHSQRRLCSVSPVTFGQHCTLATPGIGIYAAGVGALLILIGGWQIFRSQLVEPGAEGEQGEHPRSPARAEASTIAERLRRVDQLYAEGVITDAEHAQRRAELISEV